ncbi:hypothetical protein LINGRAHAP2_LOCUS10625 [Linum grandiflorum]
MDRLKTHQRLPRRPQAPHRRPHNPQARQLHPPRPALLFVYPSSGGRNYLKL